MTYFSNNHKNSKVKPTWTGIVFGWVIVCDFYNGNYV